ncbi:MAG: T9SS type A sorting domain-containing protein [Bacteroidetes bacterium]|nr:T9SS type A sorting domain-containing protein [Bacteroidota bacterium]
MQQLLRRAVSASCLFTIFILFFNKALFADVTLTTQTVAAANLSQSSTSNIVYVVKMDVTVAAVTVNNIQFTLGGTYDNNDIPNTVVWFNASTPSVTGATALVGATATFAAPHAYSLAISQTLNAGTSGYFIITVNLASAATSGNTIKVDGAANPVVFGFTSSPVVVNNQSDLAGVQTILAASVNLSSVAVAASTIVQGTSNVVTYILKMDITNSSVQMSNVQFTLGGTYDNNDLSGVSVYSNTVPSFTGASFLGSGAPGFAAPHVYTISANQVMNAGTTSYILIIVSLSSTATAGNTIKVDGAANPVTPGFFTSPNITNNQTDAAGVQTITAAGVTLSSSAVAAANVLQGTSNIVSYILKMDVTGFNVQMSNVQFTLGGTYDNNDLTGVNVYSNTVPSFTGASFLGSGGPGFAAPHVYNISANQVMNAGSTWYILVVVSLSPTATAGNTIKVDGAANPLVVSFFTGPTITNNQTDVAGAQTIVAGSVTLSSSPVSSASIPQATSQVIAYITKMDVSSFAVTANSIQYTLGGTYDNNDLTGTAVYFNASAPSLSGAVLLNSSGAGFAAPHTFNLSISQLIGAGASGYFIITADISATGTAGNTIKVNGATSPVLFTFTTGPTVTNNQTDIAGTQTITAASVTLSSIAVPASNTAQGANNVFTYIVKTDVSGLPVTVNSIQFVLGGTIDNNDLTQVAVYFNAASPVLTGATLLSTSGAGFAAPHTYNLGISNTMAAGTSGYFIITVNVSASGTTNNNFKINGATNPVVFSYTTGPSVTNNQTDIAGSQTILSAGVTLSSPAISGGNITQGTTNNIIYALKTDVTSLPVTINSIQFVLNGTYDNNDLSQVSIWYNATAPILTGATSLTSTGAGFAGPHTYTLGLLQSISAGATGYLIIATDLSPSATAGNTVFIDGAANPVVLSFTTAPPVTNNQTNSAGTQTITSVLPLRLLSFTGNVNQQQNVLQWVTSDEINTKNFEVEWSINGVDFTSIGTIPSAHNSTANKTYSFVHKTPAEGINYYRLKMTDLDGHYTYSATIKMIIQFTSTTVTVFPNPVSDVAVLHIQSAQNGVLQLQMHGADGKLVQTKSVPLSKGNNRVEWNLIQLPSGIYLVSTANKIFKPVTIVRN